MVLAQGYWPVLWAVVAISFWLACLPGVLRGSHWALLVPPEDVKVCLQVGRGTFSGTRGVQARGNPASLPALVLTSSP